MSCIQGTQKKIIFHIEILIFYYRKIASVYFGETAAAVGTSRLQIDNIHFGHATEMDPSWGVWGWKFLQKCVKKQKF